MSNAERDNRHCIKRPGQPLLRHLYSENWSRFTHSREAILVALESPFSCLVDILKTLETGYVRACCNLTALVPTVTQGTDAHCETDIRVVWNEENQTNEVHEFVYEVSWVPELLAWRRFLRTHRIVSSGEGQFDTSRR
jgi:hypothetical protein